jgi:peptidoglycan hydrolase CwlO-like protein
MDNSLLTFIISTMTGLITFFFGLRRGKREVEGIALQNIEKSLEIYQNIIDDLNSRITTLMVKVDDLEKKIDELKTENDVLKDMLKKHDKESQKRNRNANTDTEIVRK